MMLSLAWLDALEESSWRRLVPGMLVDGTMTVAFTTGWRGMAPTVGTMLNGCLVASSGELATAPVGKKVTWLNAGLTEAGPQLGKERCEELGKEGALQAPSDSGQSVPFLLTRWTTGMPPASLVIHSEGIGAHSTSGCGRLLKIIRRGPWHRFVWLTTRQPEADHGERPCEFGKFG